ncbi:MAG: hypothetical protein ACRETH_07215, partial [Steroidobacteraceae bacterium]
MANGRMLQRKISNNKDLPRLIAHVDASLGAPHGAFAALLYTWCIAHLDVDGRMHGDPEVVKGTVVPRISGITPESVRGYLRAMHELDLVTYYEADGDLWLWFRGFEEAQPGLRKDREAKSTIPPPSPPSPAGGGSTPEPLRSNAGVGPAEVKEKFKRREDQDCVSNARTRVGELAVALKRGWGQWGTRVLTPDGLSVEAVAGLLAVYAEAAGETDMPAL